jgi:hypothetical protein
MASHDATPEELVQLRALRWVMSPQPTLENAQRAHERKLPDGPTIEEYVTAGYLPETYPPDGFAAVMSPGLQAYTSGDTSWINKPQAPEAPVTEITPSTLVPVGVPVVEPVAAEATKPAKSKK